MANFTFEIGDRVVIRISSESGEVIGRVEYRNKVNQYLLRLCGNDGKFDEKWIDEDALYKAL